MTERLQGECRKIGRGGVKDRQKRTCEQRSQMASLVGEGLKSMGLRGAALRRCGANNTAAPPPGLLAHVRYTPKPGGVEDNQRAIADLDESAATKFGQHFAHMHRRQAGGIGDVVLT